MINCPQCGNQFDEKTGRRPKKFCTDPCKVKYWNAFKKKVVENTEVGEIVKLKVESPITLVIKGKENIEQHAISEKIAHYEAEMAKLSGDSEVVAILRNRYKSKIHELKKLLK